MKTGPRYIFSVNEGGAAVYDIAIHCPDGKGVTPQIGISYNSQNAGYGLAGYGFSLSGFSAITRGGKKPFNNDGVAAGVGYGADDNLYLDGKRLILISGSAFTSGAEYCLEGTPYTKVIVHESTPDNMTPSWFEVQAPDGMKYEYGHSDTSRLLFTHSGNKKCVASWHLNRTEDVYGNYATYSYEISNLQVYPKRIDYGENSVKARGVSHRIEFDYGSNHGKYTVFNIGSARGGTWQRLSSVTTYTGTTVYRKYYLSYDSNSDGTGLKFDRLISVREENGDGESLTPVKFTWDTLPAVSLRQSEFNIPTKDSAPNVTNEHANFFAADLNGDGVSDIIRVSPVTITDGTSGTGKLKLVRQEMGDNSVDYTHDRFGRVTAVKKNIGGQGIFDFTYRYDSRNRLTSTCYPGGLTTSHTYDDYGFRTRTTANYIKVYELEDYEGGASGTTVFADSIRTLREIDSRGYVTSHAILSGSKELDRMDFTFDRARGNLLTRKRKDDRKYFFDYDLLDRLTTVRRDLSVPGLHPNLPHDKLSIGVIGMSTDTVMVMGYSADGNMLSKTGVGAYSYNPDIRPHAVVGVENSDGLIPSSTLSTVFNNLDRIQTIEDEGSGLTMEFDYGPDMQRWVSTIKSHGRDSITTVYAGNYEKIIQNGRTREFYYLDGGVIVVREQNGAVKPYISFSDHQGSILSVFDKNGKNVFKADYDVWGQQTVKTNTIGLRRGYTGHEMLPEFGIINMNGRLYDPVLGRFFSPDPFVQFLGSPQGYNRYSYCLNNPLRYTDPSGQIATEVIMVGLFNMASSMMRAAATGGAIYGKREPSVFCRLQSLSA